MVRTGRRAAALQALLIQAGLRPAPVPSVPRLTDLPAAVIGDLDTDYTALGGNQPMPPVRPGAWDLAYTGEMVVELDEELYFNGIEPDPARELGRGAALAAGATSTTVSGMNSNAWPRPGGVNGGRPGRARRCSPRRA
ncbi:hypothetical protein ACFY3S_35545 [Nocardia salmonicida]|uniref:hypothetical protein n=1 Tax=Nocardia salmonicida TaxID=53431 RepID=UPI0007A4CABD|nr:hypothetical protein [Nocardia salmonicida]